MSGERKYRCQWYYKPYKQMGTGVDEYDDLAESAVALLQAQADYVAEQRGDLPGGTTPVRPILPSACPGGPPSVS